MIVKTATGSTYEFRLNEHGTPIEVRRVPASDGAQLRADEEWKQILALPLGLPTVGQRMVLVLEPLGDAGPTTRTTTEVVSIA